MIEEYFRLIALQREYSQKYEELQVRISDLDEEIHEEYRSDYGRDVIVRVDNQYYLIGDLGGIGLVDVVNSHVA